MLENVVLEEVLRYLKNWFLLPDGIHTDTYTVEDGGLSLPFLQEGQYFRVIGSVFNDELHKYPAQDMTPEAFDGTVWALAVPRAVISLADKIGVWQKKNGAAAQSPYSSESFVDYSYTAATDAETGGAVTWQSVFRSELSKWRKI